MKISKFLYCTILINVFISICGISKAQTLNETEATRYLQNQQPYNACLETGITERICNGKIDNSFNSEIAKRNNRELLLAAIALRQLGYYEVSNTILDAAQSKTNSPIELDEINLSRANLYFDTYRKFLNLSYTQNKSEKTDYVNQTISSLKNSEELYRGLWYSKEKSISINSRIGWLKLYSIFDTNISQNKNLKQSLSTVFKDNIEYLFNLNNIELNNNQKLIFADVLFTLNRLEKARDLATFVEESATAESNTFQISKATYILGRINTRQGNFYQAEKQLKKSQNLALSFNYLDLAYMSGWERGKIAVHNGDQRAIEHYKLAVDILEHIHKDMLFLNTDIQFSFLDRVEPLYREYISLLFKEKNPDLRTIINTREKLRVSELQNYLNCGYIKYESLLDTPKDSSPDAIIYLIPLTKSYEIILREKNGDLTHFRASKEIVDKTIYEIRTGLQEDTFGSASMASLQTLYTTLYNQLIFPVKNKIPKDGNVVLALESKFQNIPWSLLFDGKEYFIKNNSLTLNQGYEINKIDFNKFDIKPLVAGISNSPDLNFKSLDNVEQETKYIKEIYPKSKILIDQDFTIENLLRNQDYNVLHIASHAKANSDPKQSYILGWDKRLNVLDFNQLVRSRSSPLYLLVLSACETAVGDNRATLGIAGAAVNAGARSTVATLWLVNDKAQSLLMQQFYMNLSKRMSKAQALREAQIYIMDKTTYKNPFFWASNFLIGDWN